MFNRFTTVYRRHRLLQRRLILYGRKCHLAVFRHIDAVFGRELIRTVVYITHSLLHLLQCIHCVAYRLCLYFRGRFGFRVGLRFRIRIGIRGRRRLHTALFDRLATVYRRHRLRQRYLVLYGRCICHLAVFRHIDAVLYREVFSARIYVAHPFFGLNQLVYRVAHRLRLHFRGRIGFRIGIRVRGWRRFLFTFFYRFAGGAVGYGFRQGGLVGGCRIRHLAVFRYIDAVLNRELTRAVVDITHSSLHLLQHINRVTKILQLHCRRSTTTFFHGLAGGAVGYSLLQGCLVGGCRIRHLAVFGYIDAVLNREFTRAVVDIAHTPLHLLQHINRVADGLRLHVGVGQRRHCISTFFRFAGGAVGHGFLQGRLVGGCRICHLTIVSHRDTVLNHDLTRTVVDIAHSLLHLLQHINRVAEGFLSRCGQFLTLTVCTVGYLLYQVGLVGSYCKRYLTIFGHRDTVFGGEFSRAVVNITHTLLHFLQSVDRVANCLHIMGNLIDRLIHRRLCAHLKGTVQLNNLNPPVLCGVTVHHAPDHPPAGILILLRGRRQPLQFHSLPHGK